MLVDLIKALIIPLIAIALSFVAINFEVVLVSIAIGFFLSIYLAVLFDGLSSFGDSCAGANSRKTSATKLSLLIRKRDVRIAFLVCFFVYTSASIGASLLTQWYKSGDFDMAGFYIWLAITILPPTVFRLTQRVRKS